ncbi:MAG: alpha-1,2-fucosyltransferase [Bacteroidales bacterium]|nr:alpha-1,2-fucosyltransferase [Bacteroidales bacterium]
MKLDFSEFGGENINHEGIELNLFRFNIKGEMADPGEIENLIPHFTRINNRILRAINNRYKNFTGQFIFYKKAYIKDVWNGNPKVLKAKPTCYLDGDWGNIEYFNDIRNTLVNELSIKNKLRNEYFCSLLDRINNSKNSVGIHFRRKYEHYPHTKRIFGVLEKDYYYRGIEYLKQEYNEFELFIFADDIGWVKENFKPDHPMKIIERSEYLTDAHDWDLLKSCNHQIISNSTFSWWAGYLNPHNNHTVVAPKIWYVDDRFQKGYETGKITPSDWILV